MNISLILFYLLHMFVLITQSSSEYIKGIHFTNFNNSVQDCWRNTKGLEYHIKVIKSLGFNYITIPISLTIEEINNFILLCNNENIKVVIDMNTNSVSNSSKQMPYTITQEITVPTEKINAINQEIQKKTSSYFFRNPYGIMSDNETLLDLIQDDNKIIKITNYTTMKKEKNTQKNNLLFYIEKENIFNKNNNNFFMLLDFFQKNKIKNSFLWFYEVGHRGIFNDYECNILDFFKTSNEYDLFFTFINNNFHLRRRLQIYAPGSPNSMYSTGSIYNNLFFDNNNLVVI